MGNFSFSAGFSIFPSLLGLQFVNQPFHTSGGGLGTGVPGSVPGTGGRGGGIGGLDETLAMTAEQQQQAFLSRMLFMLGTIVVVFLLLFN